MTQEFSTFQPQVPPSVLVLEESPFWSAELSRQFVKEPISLRMRPRVRDVPELLETGTVGLLLIGLEIELPSVLRLLSGLGERLQKIATVVLLTDENRELEWSLRELGADEVVFMPVSGERLAGIIRRYLFDSSHENQTHSHFESTHLD